jgi:hypothetical protein
MQVVAPGSFFLYPFQLLLGEICPVFGISVAAHEVAGRCAMASWTSLVGDWLLTMAGSHQEVSQFVGKRGLAGSSSYEKAFPEAR